ncbi:DUF4870 domain-containing protein [Leptolyngbyaceae cyanobacterium CCMR0082]|uniref:DUF4870 domain-containing protein n=1 Tax=Adonisia turfae CCMR0082 TaxID=2304604 RepID=A0A6M0SH05_9CYAN|nr:DUF4870 domain-containing protein [Adonisia turfae]NEZ67221.1 DUF4870 domain-containing protein [Adonisia turfae CCMR0082]
MSQEKTTPSVEIFLHLSLLLSWVVPIPFIDILVPIIIWQATKKQSPQIEPHARNAINWLISSTVYSVVLLVTLVGTILLPVLWGLRFIFPIIAAIQASKGKTWKYPLAIDFLGSKPEKQLQRAAIGFLSLVVIPVAALLGSIVWQNNRVSWLDSLSPTTGTVSQVNEKTDEYGDTLYQPVVEFEGPNGDLYDVSPLGWTGSPTYKKGESVGVLYTPTEPQRAIIDSWSEKWSMVTVALVLSAIVFGFSLIPSIFCLIVQRFSP